MTADRAPDWARAFLRDISRPRLPGSEGVAYVEDVVADRLASLGFEVRRQTFTADSRRLIAASIGAAGVGWTALLATPLLMLDLPRWVAALIMVSALAVVGVIAYGLAEGHLPLDLPTSSCVNLVAVRSDQPRWWLVAHLDSKAQGVSLRGRVWAGAALVAGAIGCVGAALVHLAIPVGWYALPPLIVATGGAAALSIGPIRSDAPGAVDNASGILAVLAAAEALADCSDVGVLVTGAEEFGMVGARHWVRSGGTGEGFVNFDGLDDRGAFNLMLHRSRSDPRAAERLEDALAGALGAGGKPVRRSRLPLGVFVDGGVLVTADLPGVTVSHGDWSTLRVVHTRRDTADRLSGDAAWEGGVGAARVIRTHLVDRPTGAA